MSTHSPNPFPEEWLSAYLDGELNDEQRQLVEDGVAQNPRLAQLLDELQATRRLVRQLPKFAHSVSPRSIINPSSNTWTSELDDGLDAGNSVGISDNSTDLPTTQGSLTTASDQLLRRSLANESDEITIYRKHSSSWINYRWVALAASIICVAILASVLWPPKNDTQLVTNSKQKLQDQKSEGLGADAPVAEESLVRSEPQVAMADASPSAGGQADSESLAGSLGRQLEEGSMEFRMQASETSDAFKLPKNKVATAEAPTDPAFANLPPAPSVPRSFRAAEGSDTQLAESPDQTRTADPLGQTQLNLRSLEAEMSIANATDKQAPPAAEVLPPPQNALRSSELAKPGVAELSRAPQLDRALAPATPKQTRRAMIAAKATWHRSEAWGEESVVGQLESNAILQHLRPMLRGTYKTQQSVSPIDPSIPIVVLEADEQMRKEMIGKLQSIITPAWSETNDSITRVVFLSNEELEQVIGNSFKLEKLFWVVPSQQNTSSKLRILIVNER